MNGAVLLFQVAIAVSPAVEGPRQPVPAGPAELSEAAARIHLNRKALEGWVPMTGTPAPPPTYPAVSFAPPPQDRWRDDRPAIAEPQVVPDLPESVNPVGGPGLWFYGPGRAHRHPSVHPAPRFQQHRSSPRHGPPGGARRR